MLDGKHKWNPCLKGKHKWDNLIARHHTCTICGAVGWSAAIPPSTKQRFTPNIYECKCPGCGGATTKQHQNCPDCPTPKTKQKSSKDGFVWQDLPDSCKEAVKYLMQKDRPVTVSRSNGGGGMALLLKFGIVRKAGERSGQSTWELTEKAKLVFTDSLTLEGQADVC